MCLDHTADSRPPALEHLQVQLALAKSCDGPCMLPAMPGVLHLQHWQHQAHPASAVPAGDACNTAAIAPHALCANLLFLLLHVPYRGGLPLLRSAGSTTPPVRSSCRRYGALLAFALLLVEFGASLPIPWYQSAGLAVMCLTGHRVHADHWGKPLGCPSCMHVR